MVLAGVGGSVDGYEVRIGLTGGIGCGKTTVLEMFAGLGALTASADALAHELMRVDGDVRSALKKHWGEGVFLADGGIDRPFLAKRVFREEEELRKLERILHPRVRAKWKALLENAKGRMPVVIEIPLLFEKNLETEFDITVTVQISRTLQEERLVARGLSHEQISARISRQLSLSEKVRRADFIICNSGTLEFTQQQVEFLCNPDPLPR